MESLDTIFWVISIALSATTLCVMLFGIRLGKKALSKNFTLFGERAVKHLALLKENTLKNVKSEKYKDGGGNKRIPQLKVEKLNYDPQIMPKDWSKYTRYYQYFDKDENDPTEILVEEWRV